VPFHQLAPPRRDVAIMLAFLVPALAQVLLVPIAPRPVGVLVALLSVVPLAWHRSRPLVAAAVGVSAWLVPTDGYLVLGYVVAIVLLFSAALHSERLGRVVLLGVWGVAASLETLWWSDDVLGVATSVMVVAGSLTAGALVAYQRRQADRLRALNLELERERARGERVAVAEERARIARELHDVVGHEMTMIAIQSEAASAALRTAPERAREPIEAIRETAHRATTELRAILGVLGQDATTDRAVPDQGDLLELVDRARLLGLECTLRSLGEPWPEAPNTWLALVRILQESLTNAGRHAPGASVEACLQWSDDSVRLEVRNELVAAAPSSGSGLGLASLSERARMLGGHLEARSDADHFVVTAVLPRPWTVSA
jgi:signal transduction histidine kinase